MMSSAIDIDPTFKHALKLLHSGNSDSAEKIRNLLDELIKQRYGGNKTLNSTLSKKHLAEESTATGSNLYVRKQKPAPVVAIVPAASTAQLDSKQQSPAKSEPAVESAVPTPESLTVPAPAGSIILSISDVEGNDEDDDVVMEEDQLKELEDLMCIVCKRMDVSARNRLVECADCHSLYHQECHKPVISEADANDQENAWFCTLCKGKSASKSSSSSTPAVGSPAKVSSSSSHSKSSSSSKNYESSSSSSSSKHKSSKSSSSKEGSSHDRDRDRERDRDRDRDRDRERSDRDREKDKEKSSKSSSSGGSGSSSTAGGSSSSTSAGAGTPNINIISADKRLQMMKKKAAKMHDSKRKHK
ncbi:integrator complex subunit 12-like isoform X2 [Ochlerotatus camptorhynchus]